MLTVHDHAVLGIPATASGGQAPKVQVPTAAAALEPDTGLSPSGSSSSTMSSGACHQSRLPCIRACRQFLSSACLPQPWCPSAALGSLP